MSRGAEWHADLEDEVWALREKFSSELAGKREVHQQELQAWKEQERRRVSERGWEEVRGGEENE